MSFRSPTSAASQGHGQAPEPSDATAGIRPMRRGEERAAAACLARAFRDNPMNRAVVGDSAGRRLRANVAGMRATMVGASRLCDVRVAAGAGRIAGVLIAVPPGLHPLPPPPLGAQLRCLWGQGLRVARRWSEVHVELAAEHPVGPHWYLALLGVTVSARGAGLGSRMLACWLDAVDAEEGAAYLETDAPRNVRFYRRAGFEVVGECEILGVRVWRLWRSPGARG